MPTYPTTTENRIRHLAVFMLCLTPWHSLAGGHNSTKAQGTYQAAAILANLSGNGSGSHPSGANVSATQTAPQKHGSGWLPRNSTAWHNSSGSRELSRKQKARQFHHLQKTVKAQKDRHVADLPPRTTAQPGSFAVRTGNGLKLETRRQRQRREASGSGNVVYVGNNNFTETIHDEYNCTGNFKLFEDVTLRDLTEPVCDVFTGRLESNGSRLSLIQTGDNVASSGLFGSLDNAHVNLTLGNVRVNGTGSNIGAIANQLGSNNRVYVRGGRVEVNIYGENVENSGVFGSINGSHNIVEQEDMIINVTSTSNVSSSLGGVGINNGSNNALKQKNVDITVTAPMQNGVAGGGFGRLVGHRIHLDQRNVSGNITGHTAGGGIGVIIHESNEINLTQIGVQIVNFTKDSDRSYATYGVIKSNSKVSLRLYSGNVNGASICPPPIFGIDVTGFIDIAGYKAGRASGCGRLKPLDTTNSPQWHKAHGYLCDTTGNPNQTSCHYPHEQLVDAVHGENGTLWLVSRQSYPYKNESNPNGLVRITGINLSGVPNPTLNTSFANNGTQLLSNASSSSLPLPEKMRPTAWSASQDKLVALYPSDKNQSVMLASFPLNHTEDGADKSTYAFVNVTNVTGTPIHLTREGEDSYTIWTRENGTAEDEDIVHRYQVKESLEEGFEVINDSEYNLTLTVNPSARVLGMGSANDLLYLVHQQNGSDILLDRIDMLAGELLNRTSLPNLTLPEVPDPDEGLHYTVYPQGNDTVLLLPRRSVLTAFSPEHIRWVKVTLPEFGGRAEWQTLGEVVMEQDPDSPDNPSNSGSNAGGIAAGVVVAGAGVLTTATAIGVACSCKHSKMCKRCRKQVRQKVNLGKGIKSRIHSLKYPVQNQGSP